MAATGLGADKTYEALDDITVVEVYQAVFDGGLDECTTIIDTHLRMLAECIIQDDVELVRAVYDKFRRLPAPPPEILPHRHRGGRRGAGLLFVKEEYELVEAMWRFESGPAGDVSEEAEWADESKVIIDVMDRVIAVMHEKGRSTAKSSRPCPRVAKWRFG